MPWESRIQSERLRRVVIAALMGVLLAGSTALALWMSHARQPRFDVAAGDQQLGSFGLSIPAGWIRHDTSQHNIPQLLAVYQSPEPDVRLLQVFELDYPDARPPATSLQAIYTSFFPRSPRYNVQMIGRNGTVGAYAVEQSEEISRLGRQRRKHFAASITLDGRRHLAFYMTGLGNPTHEDLATILAVAESAVDTRYRAIGEPTIELDHLRITVPNDLIALRQAQSPRVVDLVPASDGPLASGRLVYLTLRILPLDEQTATDAPAEKPAESTAADGDVNRLLLTWLANVYQKRYGSVPPAGALESGKVNDRIVHALLLPAVTGSPMQQTLWATSPDGRSVAIMNVTAESSVARRAHAAAKMVMGNLGAADDAHAPTTDKDQAR